MNPRRVGPSALLAFCLLVAVSPLAAQDPTPDPAIERQLAEAANALGAGRTVQARAMLAEAVRMGARGEALDRLLADLDFAEGRHVHALTRARSLLLANPDDPILLERGGLSALALGENPQAEAYLSRAARLGSSRWRTHNGLGVLADRRGDWAAADAAYTRASAMEGADLAIIANNRGWSLLLQGRWEESLGPLTRAAGIEPDNPRISANLALAQMAIDEGLPRRNEDEDNADYAARLNDAGVVAARQGLRTKAIAAFTRAIEANSHYYQRAVDNLAALGTTNE